MTCTENNGETFDTLEELKRTNNGRINTCTGRFQATKISGTLWKCTILTDKDTNVFERIITFNGNDYAASYCYMRIHLRQIEPPQSILVNNMLVSAVRADLSNTDVDFTAVYNYADGDVVRVTCANLNSAPAPLTMEYAVADVLSDKYNSSCVESGSWIGFSTTLRSEHDNTYMICTNTGPADYTKIKVTFVKQTKHKLVNIKINGIIMRPILTPEQNIYKFEYKYLSNQDLNVECEVNRPDMKLVVTDSWLKKIIRGYTKNDTTIGKVSKLLFHTNENIVLVCSSADVQGVSTEINVVHFSTGDILYDQTLSLIMNIPSNGTVMELHNDFKLRVIYYAFEDGDTLNLSCSITNLPEVGPVVYVHLKDSGKIEMNINTVFKTFKLTDQMDNTDTACYIKEQIDDTILKEIRVIFRIKYRNSSITTSRLLPPAVDQLSIHQPPIAVIAGSVGAVIFIIILATLVWYYVKNRGTSSRPLPDIPTSNPRFYYNLVQVFRQFNEEEATHPSPEYEEIQYAGPVQSDVINQNDCSTSQSKNDCENEYDECHSEYSLNGESCDQPDGGVNIGEAQTNSTKVYDEPYAHINGHKARRLTES